MRGEWLLLFAAFLLAGQGSRALKCRSGNQQTDAQFEKVTQLCKRRQGTNHSSRFSGEASAASDESADSQGDAMDRRFLLRKNGRQSGNGTTELSDRRRGSGAGRGKDRKNENARSYQGRGGDRDFRNHGAAWGGDRNREESQNTKEEDCLVQCIFNELNLVDQRGFPERDAIVRLMSQNVQDPELKDFLEEATVECFASVESDGKRKKCEYSQSLLSCLVEKGKEGCEDW